MLKNDAVKVRCFLKKPLDTDVTNRTESASIWLLLHFCVSSFHIFLKKAPLSTQKSEKRRNTERAVIFVAKGNFAPATLAGSHQTLV